MSVSKIDLHPDEPMLGGENLDALIQIWLDDCSKRVMPHTAYGYTERIKRFRVWWAKFGKEHDWQLKRGDMLTFEHELVAGDLAWHTRAAALKNVKLMFKWAHQYGYISLPCWRWVPAPSGSTKIRRVPKLSVFEQVAQTIVTYTNFPERNLAIYAILLGCGTRVGECASLNYSDVQFDYDGSGSLLVKAKRVAARNLHERLIAFDSYTGAHIRRWYDIHPTRQGPLFPSRKTGLGDRLGGRSIYKMLVEAYRLAGVDEQLNGAHDLRRAFITYWRRNRKGEAFDLLLRRQIGHTTKNMTDHYDLSDVVDIQRAMISVFSLLRLRRVQKKV